MKTLVLYCLLLTLAVIAVPLHAAEPFDPAARAKVIAPFIEEETIAIVHVDFSRIDVDAAVDQWVKWLPEIEPMSAKARKQGKQMIAAISKADIREMYCVVTLGGPLTHVHEHMAFVVVPLPAGTGRDAPPHELPQAKLLKKMGAGRLLLRDDILVAGTKETIDRLATIMPDVRGELEKAFEAAGDTAAQFLLLPPKHSARTLQEIMPELPKQLGGGPSSVLTRGCRWAALGIDRPPSMTIHGVIQSADHEAAKTLAAKWWDVGVFLDRHLRVSKKVPNADELWKALAPQVQGDRLVWTLDRQGNRVAKMVALLKPIIRQGINNQRRAQSMNNVRQIALAMHRYHNKHKAFPAAASLDKNGRPLLSWRVHILPYLEQKKLYEQFHLDEPWDSPHNKKLIEQMPSVYRSTASKRSDRGRTNYVVPIGKDTAFNNEQGVSIKDITDGNSNTIMILEADDTHAPIWSKPQDLPFDPDNPKRGLGGLGEDKVFLVAFCDGSACVVSSDVDAALFRNLLTIAGGEPVNAFFEKR